MNYNYDGIAKYAEVVGVVWKEKLAEDFDQMAKAHGFSQAQVDIAVQHHLIQVRRMLSPKSYGFCKRFALGIKFIWGKI